MNSSRLAVYKSLFRNKLRYLISRIPAPEKARKSRLIASRIFSGRLFKAAKNILIYCALADEVDTSPVIRKALSLRKKVFLPRLDPRSRELSIFLVGKSGGLEKNFLGIPEPGPLLHESGSPESVDLILVPGLGFDASGRRLGRGGGSFDRFLSKCRAKKVGLAFREQVVEELPAAPHDIRMDQVVTD